MIVGVGVDVVDLARFERAATRTPALLPRLFAESERASNGRALSIPSLAGRFAAKEALIKALGGSGEMRWHDVAVMSDADGNPSFTLTGGAKALADSLSVTAVHLSMSHDGGVATAFVIAERNG